MNDGHVQGFRAEYGLPVQETHRLSRKHLFQGASELSFVPFCGDSSSHGPLTLPLSFSDGFSHASLPCNKLHVKPAVVKCLPMPDVEPAKHQGNKHITPKTSLHPEVIQSAPSFPDNHFLSLRVCLILIKVYIDEVMGLCLYLPIAWSP